MSTTSTPNKQYRYNWQGGNSFKLHIDGEEFFPAMLSAIEAADSYVLLEMYLFKSGQVANKFISTLCSAARRNVTVAVMLDSFGTLELNKVDRIRLIEAGVHLSYYNPLSYKKLTRNLFRNHRKILVTDGTCAFVGGAGITDDFDRSIHPQLYWRDTMLEIQGPNTFDWKQVFLNTWEKWGNRAVVIPATDKGRAKIMVEGQMGRVTVTHALFRSEAMRALIKRIRKANTRVWLTTAYFAPSWKLRRALKLAASKNVDVRLLVPGPNSDHAWIRQFGHSEYGRLLRHGVKIYEYQPRFLHAKVHMCDDWVIMGSSNMDRWNLRWNLEADQAVLDAKFANDVTSMILTDFENSVEVNGNQWINRPRIKRLKEWFWSRVARLLEHLSRIFQQ